MGLRDTFISLQNVYCTNIVCHNVDLFRNKNKASSQYNLQKYRHIHVGKSCQVSLSAYTAPHFIHQSEFS
jgi:hypothetical protein